jgi:hypothetical protein
MPQSNNDCDSTEELLAAYRKVLEAPDDKQYETLCDFTFGSFGSVFKQLRQLRARLPFPPWLIKTVWTGFILSILGAGAWLIRMDVRACTALDEAHEAKAALIANYEKLDNRLRPAENGIVKLLADMDNLRAARGVAPSTPTQQYRVRVKLGLSPDSVPVESLPLDSVGP